MLGNMNKELQNRKAIKAKLASVRAWAQEAIQEGSQPPWAWYQYMKLVEAIDAIQSGMGSINQKVNLPPTAMPGEKPLRLVASRCRLDNAPRHPVEKPVQLPM